MTGLQHARNIRLWVLFGVLVAIMQFSDPLGDSSLRDTLIFWSGRLGALAGSLWGTDWALRRWFSARWNSPAWLKPALISIVIAAIPLTAVELVLESIVSLDPAYDDSALIAIHPALWIASEYLTVLSVVLPVNALLWVLIDLRAQPPAVAASAATDTPDFLRKTHGIRTTDVIALRSEEHYVRVLTATGSELVYGRLTDAIAQMPDSLGLQVHRSWWVADRAVESARRGARRFRLELVDGSTVPVSDRFQARVRERGLLRSLKRPS